MIHIDEIGLVDLYEILGDVFCQLLDFSGKLYHRIRCDNINLFVLTVKINNILIRNFAVVSARPVLKQRIASFVQAQCLLNRVVDILLTDWLDEKINRMNLKKLDCITALC